MDELQQQLRHSQGETAKLRDWQDITKQVHADRMREAGQLAQAEQAKLQALVHQRWAGVLVLAPRSDAVCRASAACLLPRRAAHHGA